MCYFSQSAGIIRVFRFTLGENAAYDEEEGSSRITASAKQNKMEAGAEGERYSFERVRIA